MYKHFPFKAIKRRYFDGYPAVVLVFAAYLICSVKSVVTSTSPVQSEGIPALCPEEQEVKSLEAILATCTCEKYYLLWPNDKVTLSERFLIVMKYFSEMLSRVYPRSVS